MNNQSDSDRDPLLDATLADDQWHVFNHSLRGQAVSSFQTAQRQRRWRERVMLLTVAMGLLAAGAWWLRFRDPAIPLLARVSLSQSGARGLIRHFSDQELLAMFPKGSCVFAEIDGRRELVLLDRELAARDFRFPDDVGR